MTTLHYVKKARKAIKGTDIKKGDSYYWWQFAFSRKQVSKTHPRRSQYMTRSAYLSQIMDLEDRIEELTVADLSEGLIDEICGDIESIRDEAESSLDNIPEQLKEAPAGAMLQEYIDNLESWQSDLESVDMSGIDEDYSGDAEDEWDAMDKEERRGVKKAEWVTERAKELLDERLEEILGELQGVSYPG